MSGVFLFYPVILAFLRSCSKVCTNKVILYGTAKVILLGVNKVILK